MFPAARTSIRIRSLALVLAMIASAAIVPASAKDTGALCALSYDAVTEATEAGSNVPAGATLLGFDVETALSAGDRIVITFPAGTVFTGSLQATDLLIHQASAVVDPSCTPGKGPGQAAHPETLEETGSGTDAPNLVLGIDPTSRTSGGQGGKAGAGRITVTVNASSPNTITHPATATVGELRIETRRASGTSVDSGTLAGITFIAPPAAEPVLDEPAPNEEPETDDTIPSDEADPSLLEEAVNETANETVVEETVNNTASEILPEPSENETVLVEDQVSSEDDGSEVADDEPILSEPILTVTDSTNSADNESSITYSFALPATEPGAVIELNSTYFAAAETAVIERLVIGIDPALGETLTDFTLEVSAQFAGPTLPVGEVNMTDLANRMAHVPDSVFFLHVTATNQTSARLNEVLSSLNITFRVPVEYFVAHGLASSGAKLLEYHDSDNDEAGEFVQSIPLSAPVLHGTSYLFQQELFEFSSFVLIAAPIPVVPVPVPAGPCYCSWSPPTTLTSVPLVPPVSIVPPPADAAPVATTQDAPLEVALVQEALVPAAILQSSPTPDLTAAVATIGGATILGLLFLSTTGRVPRAPPPSLARRIRTVRSVPVHERPSLGRRISELRNR